LQRTANKKRWAHFVVPQKYKTNIFLCAAFHRKKWNIIWTYEMKSTQTILKMMMIGKTCLENDAHSHTHTNIFWLCIKNVAQCFKFFSSHADKCLTGFYNWQIEEGSKLKFSPFFFFQKECRTYRFRVHWYV
jgi:hypothetical protein